MLPSTQGRSQAAFVHISAVGLGINWRVLVDGLRVIRSRGQRVIHKLNASRSFASQRHSGRDAVARLSEALKLGQRALAARKTTL